MPEPNVIRCPHCGTLLVPEQAFGGDVATTRSGTHWHCGFCLEEFPA